MAKRPSKGRGASSTTKGSKKAGSSSRSSGGSRSGATKGRSSTRSKGASRSKGSATPWWRRALRATLRLSVAAVLAAGLGAALVIAVLYNEARREVDARLSTGIWEQPARVWSGPMQVRSGLAISPEELAQDLQGAGYARVDHASRPGDFQVSGDSVLVHNPERSGPGWKIQAEELLITFEGDRVRSVSPSDPATFAPTRLATLRGADNEERTPRTLQDFPEHLRLAVLAMEDARFFEHKGISPIGILRALYVNAVQGDSVQGGSTLTQQLAKNLFLTQERTLTRKARELLFAFALEQELTKDELLALYLNEIYWGQAGGASICGADQAARSYFGKPVDRLTLGEAAALAGVISSPNAYSPLRHPDKAQERRDLALDRMVAEGWLPEAEAKQEQAKPLKVISGVRGRVAPYAVDAAVEKVESLLGDAASSARGLAIHTTIDPALQRIAERALAESLDELEGNYPEVKGVQGALVAVRASDGAILALVGGRDYGESQFNRATLAERQAGSTVKPLTLLAAFDADPVLSPSTTTVDEAIERTIDGKVWRPTNYDGRYAGEITLRKAIADSRNIPAVLLAEEVGYGALERHLEDLGLAGATRLPSVSLGAFEATPVEMAAAYTVFPGRGRVARPQLLRRVTDGDDSLLFGQEPVRREIASERATYLATSVLESVIQEGTGASASRYGATGALGGKTGTTDNYRDAWFVGFTPELAVAVWVGFDQGKSTGLSGAKAALPAWARFVADSGTTRGSFKRPRDVVEAEFCDGEFVAGECDSCVTELYTRGEEPTNGCRETPLSAVLDVLRGTEHKPSIEDKKKPKKPEQPSGKKTATKRRRWFW
ncbi:MAG: PBP1A family penicillin-binding protein [Alphaproteobacteria bacterium]|nr:PBP1A family penicillin-binding protein [Alphaproteobacteria bacterium]